MSDQTPVPMSAADSQPAGAGQALLDGSGLRLDCLLRLSGLGGLGGRGVSLVLVFVDRQHHSLLRSPLPDPALLPHLLSQVVEASLADVAVADNIDLVDSRRVDEERALNADSMRHPADREVAAQPGAGDADDGA